MSGAPALAKRGVPQSWSGSPNKKISTGYTTSDSGVKGTGHLPKLGPDLAGKIASYNAIAAVDVARLRGVGRSFGKAIRSEISSKNARHNIECPGRLGGEKSFVSELTSLGGDVADDIFSLGDLFEESGVEQNLFPGDGVSLERVFLVGELDEDAKVDAKFSSEDVGQKEAMAHEIREVTSSLDNATSMSELESICKDAKSRGLFEPIETGEDVTRTGGFDIMVTLVFDIREGSDCIVSTTDTYLELRTADAPDEGDDHPLGPVHPNSTYLAPISEVREFDGGSSSRGQRVFRICALMESTMPDDWIYNDDLGDYVSSLRFDELRNKHQNRIGPVEGVAIIDDFLGEDLVQTLTSNIDALASYQEKHDVVDYHPHSNGVVRDIVHPGLYSYVQGISELRASVKDAEPCNLPRHDSNSDCDNDSHDNNSHDEVASDGYGQGISDFWGRNEWDKYQWLPTYFDISRGGECKIEHYINGLAPRDLPVNAGLHQSLAHLFETAIPYINSVYSYTRAVRPMIRDEVEDEMDDITVQDLSVTPYNLKGNKLQVITKIVEYELEPGQSHEGVWHVEGMSQEDIVLTVLYVLDRDDNISGGDIMFKRAFLKDEASEIFYSMPQTRHPELDKAIKNGLVPLGKVETPKGRLIVFPNSHVHRVTMMVNNGIAEGPVDETVTPILSKRRIVVFFLVNPLRRIVSTREVAPQKGGAMTHEDALNHRLELMKVRKYHKQDWNVRTIELCEH